MPSQNVGSWAVGEPLSVMTDDWGWRAATMARCRDILDAIRTVVEACSLEIAESKTAMTHISRIRPDHQLQTQKNGATLCQQPRTGTGTRPWGNRDQRRQRLQIPRIHGVDMDAEVLIHSSAIQRTTQIENPYTGALNELNEKTKQKGKKTEKLRPGGLPPKMRIFWKKRIKRFPGGIPFFPPPYGTGVSIWIPRGIPY